MKIQKVAIETLVPYARNPRNNKASVAKVAASIQAFGWKQPIVVDCEMVIVAGHTRWLAAKQLNLSHVPVLVAKDLTPSQIKAYRLADNRTHEDATWDNELLAIELGELSELDIDISVTGFTGDEIQGLMALAQAVEEGLTDDDDCPPIVETPVSVLGDVWLLGRHRLMCGDSTCVTSVEILMAGEQADMVFTDPPYNVDYEGYTKEKLKISHDNLSETQFYQFLLAVFASHRLVMKQGASLYVCHGSSYQREFQNALEANGFCVRTQIIWAKHHFAWGHGRYKFKHEPIFYCHQQGQSDAWYGDKTQSTLWHIDKPAANRLHPTMKPVGLIEIALNNSSKAGDVIMDLFAGSGSTLIACEKTARHARLMELDPKYCDVVIKRWQAFTGQKAMLEGKNLTFDEIAAKASAVTTNQ